MELHDDIRGAYDNLFDKLRSAITELRAELKPGDRVRIARDVFEGHLGLFAGMRGHARRQLMTSVDFRFASFVATRKLSARRPGAVR